MKKAQSASPGLRATGGGRGLGGWGWGSRSFEAGAGTSVRAGGRAGAARHTAAGGALRVSVPPGLGNERPPLPPRLAPRRPPDSPLVAASIARPSPPLPFRRRVARASGAAPPSPPPYSHPRDAGLRAGKPEWRLARAPRPPPLGGRRPATKPAPTLAGSAGWASEPRVRAAAAAAARAAPAAGGFLHVCRQRARRPLQSPGRYSCGPGGRVVDCYPLLWPWRGSSPDRQIEGREVQRVQDLALLQGPFLGLRGLAAARGRRSPVCADWQEP